MLAFGPRKTGCGEKRSGQSGQALVEYAISVLVMATLAFGVIDFTRAIYEQQVITILTGQGADLAFRGSGYSDSALLVAANAVISASPSLNLGSNGRIIVSATFNSGNPNAVTISNQASVGGISASSRIGTKGGIATLPPGTNTVTNQTVCVMEIFYAYQPITPVGKLLKTVMPAQLYDVAYY